jgi:hypothetical protein
MCGDVSTVITMVVADFSSKSATEIPFADSGIQKRAAPIGETR